MRDSRQNTNIFTFITMYDQFKIPDNIRYQYVLLLSYNTWTITLISTSLCDQYKYYYGSTAAAVILRRMGKNKAQAPTLPRIRYMCFDLTHAPVATAARAAATGLVSMSTRPDPEGSGTVSSSSMAYLPSTSIARIAPTFWGTKYLEIV